MIKRIIKGISIIALVNVTLIIILTYASARLIPINKDEMDDYEDDWIDCV